MGIQGLIPFLKPIHENIHVRDLSGQRVGVDAYVWLHRGAFACAMELVMGIPTRKYIAYCMKKVKLLRDHGVTPVIVFDGGYLPMKAATESERRERRQERRQKGMAYWKSGDKTKAIECFQTCVDVTPEMAYELIKTLRLARVEYIVAPYEADAQLAYLQLNKKIDAVLTEDSDLLVFGTSSDFKVIFKLDPAGNALQIRTANFGNVPGMRFWTHDMFRHMCILSGCDYLESPQGIGLKKAQGLIQKSSDVFSLIQSWNIWGTTVKAPKLPENYLQRFTEADQTFLYQRVYNPDLRRLVTLHPLPEDLIHIALCDFIGADLEPELAQAIAEGNVDPITKTPFSDQSPLQSQFENLNSSIPLKRTYSTPDLYQGSHPNKLRTPLQPVLQSNAPLVSSQPITSSEAKREMVKSAIIRVEPKKPITASLNLHSTPFLKPTGRLSLPAKTTSDTNSSSGTGAKSSFFKMFNFKTEVAATGSGKAPDTQNVPGDVDDRTYINYEKVSDQGKSNQESDETMGHHYHQDVIIRKQAKSKPASDVKKAPSDSGFSTKHVSGQMSLDKFTFKGFRLKNSLQVSAVEHSSRKSDTSNTHTVPSLRPFGLKKDSFSKSSLLKKGSKTSITLSAKENIKPAPKGKTLGLRTSTMPQCFKNLVGSFEYKPNTESHSPPQPESLS